MIGDIVEIKPHHLPPARKIIELTEDSIKQKNGIFTFTVGGESGSGKSTLSLALKEVLKNKGYRTFIFHLDDYFRLPPKDNHDQRVADISNVGPQEVNLSLLQKHINKVKSGADTLKKPLVHYRENEIREVIVELEDVDIVITEGTYATLLEEIDSKIFMLRNYKDTYEDRVKRARDPIVPFTEKVLKIEHEILRDHIPMANLLVDKNYNVSTQ
jgi:uridine kinase